MCTSCCRIAALIAVAAIAVQAQAPRPDPERILADRFHFTAAEISQARQGQPVTRVESNGDDLTVFGASRLPGKKERLSDWVKNVDHFRRSAELGMAQVVAAPAAAAGFAGLTLDAADVAELQHCAAGDCAIRMSGEAVARLHQVPWGSPGAASQANAVFRDMLVGYVNAYVRNGHAGIAAFDGPHARRSFDADMRLLVSRATALNRLSPELVSFLDAYPKTNLKASDQAFYWSIMPAGSSEIVGLHHLVEYKPRPGEIWIADKNLYASRYFDEGVLAMALYDAPDGNGFLAVVGSRVKASRLGGIAGTVFRRQIRNSAADSVKMYLEWMRDSLAASL